MLENGLNFEILREKALYYKKISMFNHNSELIELIKFKYFNTRNYFPEFVLNTNNLLKYNPINNNNKHNSKTIWYKTNIYTKKISLNIIMIVY